MVIETRRLSLRPVTHTDAQLLTRLDADPEVMHYITGGVPTPFADIADWMIPRALTESAGDTGGGLWLATEHATGYFVGWFSLRAPRHSPSRELELSYRLHRRAWGRGFATEGSQRLIDHAFINFRVSRIFAGTMAVHTGSRRVMEKCGMRLVSVHQCPDETIPGAERGDVEYDLLVSDWATMNFPQAYASRSFSGGSELIA